MIGFARAAVAAILMMSALLAALPASAQSVPRFVPLPPAMGAYYTPTTGPAPHVALIVMHRTANYMTHIACTELSTRGFAVLCMNNRFVNNEMKVDWDSIALDVKAGVQFLRSQPGITKIVLFGHSGGGPIMSYYQAVAEKGVAYCNTVQKIVPCTAALAGLPPVDGLVFADPHPGQPVIVTRGLNPAYGDDRNPPDAKRIAALDPFDPKNGYNPSGVSTYSAEFRKRYFAAQAARMARLTEEALRKRDLIRSGKYPYPDDDIIIAPGGGNPGSGPGGSPFLYALDTNIAEMNSTAQPEKLLKNDGTIVTQVVKSVVAPDPALAKTNATFDVGTKVFSVNSFLSANAIRGSGDGLLGFDYCSANNSTWCAVEQISVPALFTSMGGFFLVRDGEVAYQKSASKDKDFVVIEGALHSFQPCRECETTPGQYGNTVRNLFDYIGRWINARF